MCKTARFTQSRLTYFSFASCHVNIDHHDMPHVTSHTRPFSRFSACNIEKLGVGLGTRLDITHLFWVKHGTPTYQQLIQMLNKAESEAGDVQHLWLRSSLPSFLGVPSYSSIGRSGLVFGDREEDCWPHYSG